MNFTDPVWQHLQNAHNQSYDVAAPLQKLEAAAEGSDLTDIWAELWVHLHFKGRVGTASYFALPQLTRIAKEKKLTDWNILALCSVIEQQRHLRENPTLPGKYSPYYLDGIAKMTELGMEALANEASDNINRTVAMSAIATAKGQMKLGKAIMQLADEELLDEFLIQF